MRITVFLVLFLVFFNAGAVLLNNTGGDALLGIDAPEEVPDRLETAKNESKTIDPGSGGGGTLFTTINSLGQTLEVIVNGISPGAVMLKRAGFPGAFINYAFAAMPLIIGFDLISFFRNTEMVS